MFELLYTSISSYPLSEIELADILEQAQLKNKQLNITGMLAYHDREIIQILEGEEASVKSLFNSIAKDTRHMSVDVFYQGSISNRSFSKWSMTFSILDKNMIHSITENYKGVAREKSPIKMLKNSSNRGKKMFLSLLGTL